MLTAERLRSVLNYSHETGLFTWAVNKGQRGRVGHVAGGKNDGGYIRIRVDGALYVAHRLAWLHATGKWPDDQIDHINGVRSDNRLCNLRQATNAQNVQNQRKAHSRNKTGLLGVSHDKGKIIAQIRVNKKLKRIGTYATPELAHAAYLKAKAALHPFQTLTATLAESQSLLQSAHGCMRDPQIDIRS